MINIDKYSEITPKNLSDRSKFSYNLLIKKYSKIIGNLPKDSQILEIGPGDGEFMNDMIINHYNINPKNIFFADLSKGVIQDLKEKPQFDGANFFIGEAFDMLKDLDKQFDLIILKHVIEHFDKEYTQFFIENISKYLKKGGKLLIETPNGFNMYFGLICLSADFTHKQVLSEKSLEQAFKMYFPDKFSINFYGKNKLPRVFHIHSAIGYLVKKFVSLVSRILIKINSGASVSQDFVIALITKE